MIKLFFAQKAFTLIELTVSLAVITIILTMSTIGLISLRESLQLNSASQGLLDSLQLARSYALNNVTVEKDPGIPIIPTLFTISLSGNSIDPVKLNYCIKPSNVAIEDIDTKSPEQCFILTTNTFESDTGSISIGGFEGNTCSEIGFLTGTGEIYVKKGDEGRFLSYSNGGGVSESKCEFEIKSLESLIDRRVYIEVNAIAQTIRKK